MKVRRASGLARERVSRNFSKQIPARPLVTPSQPPSSPRLVSDIKKERTTTNDYNIKKTHHDENPPAAHTYNPALFPSLSPTPSTLLSTPRRCRRMCVVQSATAAAFHSFHFCRKLPAREQRAREESRALNLNISSSSGAARLGGGILWVTATMPPKQRPVPIPSFHRY